MENKVLAGLFEIILNFFKNDREVLFNCLLSNHYISRKTIPILWGNPFTLTKDNHRRALLIHSYLLCLPREAKERMIQDGVRLETSQPYCNYPQYLKVLDVSSITSTLATWFQSSIPRLSHDQKRNVALFFLRMMFSQPTDLTHIINYPNKVFRQGYEALHYDLFTNSIHHLQTLEVTFSRWTAENEDSREEILFRAKFLKFVAQNSKHIENIKIILLNLNYCLEIEENLALLIKSQKNLLSIEFPDSLKSLSSNIFKSLLVQSHSLRKLSINKFNTLYDEFFQGLKSWKKLNTLYCEGCPADDNIPQELESQQLPIQNLSLQVEESQRQPLFISLLRMANKKLKKLVLIRSNLEIIQTVIQSCPNITHLSIYNYTHDYIESFFKLFRSLALERLILLHHNYFFSNPEILNQFNQSLPKTLKHLTFDFDIFSYSLSNFFEIFKIPIQYFEIRIKTIDDYNILTELIQYKIENKDLKELTLYLENVGSEECEEFVNESTDFITIKKYDEFNL